MVVQAPVLGKAGQESFVIDILVQSVPALLTSKSNVHEKYYYFTCR
jgi:hypothetical protein